jgi:hypothetical protein
MKKPEDLFRAEKERSLTVRNSQHARLLAEAKAAFDKLMAEGQAARKSGRPRKHPLPPLKTSSSTRPPIKPAAAPTPVSAPTPVVAKAVPVKPAEPVRVAKSATKPAAKTAAKHTPSKKPAKAASSSKTKVKLKRSTKR